MQSAWLAKSPEVHQVKTGITGIMPVIRIISCDRDISGNENIQNEHRENLSVQTTAAPSWQSVMNVKPIPRL